MYASSVPTDFVLPGVMYTADYKELVGKLDRAIKRDFSRDASYGSRIITHADWRHLYHCFYDLRDWPETVSGVLAFRKKMIRVRANLKKQPSWMLESSLSIGAKMDAGMESMCSWRKEDVLAALDKVWWLLEQWTPICLAVKAAKERVIPGRKPSDRPHDTKARTIENTGSCGGCFQNVKLKSGKIVHHGFEVPQHWGGRRGGCFGTGLPPWEISPVGQERLLAGLKSWVGKHTEQAAKLRSMDPEAPIEFTRKDAWGKEHKYTKPARVVLDGIELELLRLGRDITATQALLRDWKPQPLPGEKRA